MNNLNVKKNVVKSTGGNHPTKKSSIPTTTASTVVKDTAGFATIGSLFEKFELEDKGGYITQEFQDFGYRMALELDDLPHKSLYMRLSKTVDRLLLERALSFVSDAQNAKSKAKLFMWKLKELRAEAPKKNK